MHLFTSGRWAQPAPVFLGADVTAVGTAAFKDGPTVDVGLVGTFDVSASVLLVDTAGVAIFNVKLWDGTTIIASTRVRTPAANQGVCVTLVGRIVNPAAALRVSAQNVTDNTGLFAFNASGASMDSGIRATRNG